MRYSKMFIKYIIFIFVMRHASLKQRLTFDRLQKRDTMNNSL